MGELQGTEAASASFAELYGHINRTALIRDGAASAVLLCCFMS